MKTKTFREQWPYARRTNWPCHFETAAFTAIETLEAERAELIAALRGILDAPGEGYVTMSEPDSFETQCRKASEILARLQS